MGQERIARKTQAESGPGCAMLSRSVPPKAEINPKRAAKACYPAAPPQPLPRMASVIPPAARTLGPPQTMPRPPDDIQTDTAPALRWSETASQTARRWTVPLPRAEVVDR